jgi:hypothetical protein
MGHVFVSYSRQDAAYVTRLVEQLRQAGINVWVDEEIESGDRWEHLIKEQVDACQIFLPVMSPDAENSPWVGREIARAEAKASRSSRCCSPASCSSGSPSCSTKTSPAVGCRARN